MVELAVLDSVVFAFGLVSRGLERTILIQPMAFVAAGVLLGPTIRRSVPPVVRQTSFLLLVSVSEASWSVLCSSSCIFLIEA